AARQGKFWEMYDLLFINQNYWSTLGNVTAEFEGYAQQLGLDLEQVREDIRSSDVTQKVRNDQLGGTRAGVRSTPTIFIDGRLVPTPRNASELIAAVTAASRWREHKATPPAQRRGNNASAAAEARQAGEAAPQAGGFRRRLHLLQQAIHIQARLTQVT